MTCNNHPGTGAVGACENCGKEFCAICMTHVGDRAVCRDCADVLRNQQPAPAPEEIKPEEKPEEKRSEEIKTEEKKPEEPRLVTTVAPGERASPPAPAEPSLVPATRKPSSLATATHSVPPALNEPGAGSPRKKESLLSAALSLILPGAGQIYNGHIAKGVILAIMYFGSIAIIAASMVMTAMVSRQACWFCLPAFVLPLIVLVYAIYEAYDNAEKINDNVPVRDWL